MPFRFAIHTLLRSPWYAATAIGTIVLTIALGATVFAVVDGVLFKPLPYRKSGQLFQVTGASAEPRSPSAALSALDVKYLRESDSRIQVTAFGSGASLTHPDRPDLAVWSAVIASNFFDVLGQQPLVGRFNESDFDTPSALMVPRPAIVTHGFWQQRLGSDPSAVGRVIDMLDGRFTIAGVLPRDFVFPSYDGRRRPDILLPLIERASNRWARSLFAVVRVPDDMKNEEAGAKLSAALATRVGEYSVRPEAHPGPFVAVRMRPLDSLLGVGERRFFTAAFAGAALLIVLGAINVAGLFAARARDRERELSIRAALGAGRRQLVAVLLSEAVLIAVIGGAVGVMVAGPALAATLSVLPETVLLLKHPAIDWRVLTFSFIGAVVPVVLFALVPAAGVLRDAPAHRLAGGATSTPPRRKWSRSALLAAESAIGVLLLLAGSLILASFVVLRGQDAGFDSDGLALVELRIAGRTTPEEREVAHARAFDRIRQISGVLNVATISAPLLDAVFTGSEFAFPSGARRISANDIGVSSAFFEVAGLRLLDGRFLTRDEIETRQPVVVVSEQTARAYWPNRPAVGQPLESTDLGVVTVVGVVEEATFGSQADRRELSEIYLPQGFSPRLQSFRGVYLLKTAGDPDAAVRDIALVLRRDVPGVLARRAESLDEALARSVSLYRFRTIIFAMAGGAGLLLLVVGVGGIVASGVARRVREIGIRSALGAPQGRLVTMIVLEHLRPVILGVAFGLLFSWWTTRLVTAFLYQIDPHEPLVWTAAVGTLLLVAIIAAWIPARRASAVDPIVVLRIE